MSFIALSPSALKTLRNVYSERDRTYIWRALHYKLTSDTARQIRAFALQLGGKIIKD